MILSFTAVKLRCVLPKLKDGHVGIGFNLENGQVIRILLPSEDAKILSQLIRSLGICGVTEMSDRDKDKDKHLFQINRAQELLQCIGRSFSNPQVFTLEGDSDRYKTRRDCNEICDQFKRLARVLNIDLLVAVTKDDLPFVSVHGTFLRTVSKHIFETKEENAGNEPLDIQLLENHLQQQFKSRSFHPQDLITAIGFANCTVTEPLKQQLIKAVLSGRCSAEFMVRAWLAIRQETRSLP